MNQSQSHQHSEIVSSTEEKWLALAQQLPLLVHELRNPLSLIDLYTTLVKEQISPSRALKPPASAEEILPNLQQIQSAVRHLEALLVNIRQYGSTRTLHLEYFNLEGLIQEVCQFYKPQFEQHHVELQMQSTLLKEISYRGDPVRLRQALMNLLKNALEATPAQGTVTVKIYIEEEVETCPSFVSIEISDTGTGIPPAVLSRLFQPFSTSKPTGTGLGLSITQQLIAAHHGELSLLRTNTSQGVASEGTVFQIRLPLNFNLEGSENPPCEEKRGLTS